MMLLVKKFQNSWLQELGLFMASRLAVPGSLSMANLALDLLNRGSVSAIHDKLNYAAQDE